MLFSYFRFVELLASVTRLSSYGFASRSSSVCLLVLAVFHQKEELFIVLLDMLHKVPILLVMNSQESGHHDEFLYLRVVVSIIEEFVQSVAALLRLCDKQKVVLHLLSARVLDVLH